MISFKFVLYIHKTLSNGKNPVVLQATENGKVKKFSTGFDGLPKDWDAEKQRFKKSVPNAKAKNTKLDELNMFAQSLLTAFLIQGKRLTLQDFMSRLKNESESTNVLGFFNDRIKELQNSQDAGNAFVYSCSRNAFRKFANKDICFADIDYNFLTKWEHYLRAGGAADGGISNYFRTFRALFNEAIRRGLAEQSMYPFATQFNKNGYKISKLKVKITSRALTTNDLDNFKEYNGEDYKHTYLVFMFSYYVLGINFTDVARLREENIVENVVTFKRQKNKKKSEFMVKVPLHEKAKEILEYFKPFAKDGYLFPILSAFHKTEQQKFDRIVKKRKHFNEELKKIAEIQRVEADITSYYSRHTSIMNLKHNNVQEDLICEMAGITDPKTKKHYFGASKKEVLQNAISQLQ